MAEGIPILPIILSEVGGRGRVIVLQGQDLPHDGMESWLGGEVRGKERYYPGSSIPTSQILGSKESPITFGGMFEDRRAGVPGHAAAMAFYIDEIRRAARPVNFAYGPFFRRCRWVNFQMQPKEMQRIAYRLELAIIDHGFGERLRIFQGASEIPSLDVAQTVAARLATLLGQLPIGVGPAPLRAARNAIQIVQSSTFNAETLLGGALAVTTTKLDDSAAKAAVREVDIARGSTNEIVDSLQATSYRRAAGPDINVLLGTGDVKLEATKTAIDLSGELRRTRGKIAGLTGDSDDDLVYIVGQNDTLRSIALTYYGAEDDWIRIFDYNALRSPNLTAGQLLVLPQVPSADKALAQVPLGGAAPVL